MLRTRSTRTAALLALAAACLLAACASQSFFQMGKAAAAAGDWDLAVLHYTRAVQEKPNDVERQVALERAKIDASNMHFQRAKVHLAADNLEQAIVELQQAINLHPANQFAFQELQKAVQKLKERKAVATGEKTELEILKEKAKQPIGSPPRLDPASDIDITIKFEDKPLEEILSAVGAVYGINFLYDDTVRKENQLSVELTGVSFEEALELIMLQSGNAYTVISENTLMVYPDTQTKQREWEDQVIKTFYLSNADVNDVNSLLRTLIESRRVSINKQLNAISIRDTLDKIAIADQIIKANDKAKSEVIIDVELLQVDRSVLQQIGVDLDAKTVQLGYDNAQSGLRLNNLNPLADLGSYVLAPIPRLTLRFLRQHSLSRQLARPQVRATEGERVSIHIGDQVPIPNTTFSASQTVGGNIVPITSFTYQNVGIQVQIEPRVHHNKEVTLRLEMEVSNITSTNQSGQPTIGTREVSTVIRLKDGETNLLAGLFKEEDIKGLSTVPGIDDIPGVRKIFGGRDRTLRQTDILLTLTPHIIRIPDIREDDLRPLWVGTERNIRMRNKGALRGGYGQGPFGQESAEAAYELFRDDDEELDPAEIQRLLEEPADEEIPGDEDGVEGEPAPAFVPAPAEEEAEAPARTPTPSRSPSTSRQGSSSSPRAGLTRNPSGSRSDASPPPSSGRPVRLLVTPARAQVAAGGTIRVQLRIDAAGNQLSGVPFYLRWDPTVIEVVGIEEGPFLESSGRSVLFQTSIDQAAGRAVVGASLAGTGEGAVGTGLLATIVLRGVEPGSTTLRVDNIQASAADGGSIPAAPTAGSIQVR